MKLEDYLKIYSTSEAVKYLGISAQVTLDYWKRIGKIKSIKIKGKNYYTRFQLDYLLKYNTKYCSECGTKIGLVGPKIKDICISCWREEYPRENAKYQIKAKFNIKSDVSIKSEMVDLQIASIEAYRLIKISKKLSKI